MTAVLKIEIEKEEFSDAQKKSILVYGRKLLPEHFFERKIHHKLYN